MTMADHYMNHLFVTGSSDILDEFKVRCRGHMAFIPVSKREYFESLHGEELKKISREKRKKYQEAKEPNAHARASIEAWNEIVALYGEPSDDEYLNFANEKRRVHFDDPPQFCLNALHPVPQDVIDKWGYSGDGKEGFVSKQDDPINYTRDVYQWCKENWGTKWDVCGERMEGKAIVTEGESFLSVHFETALAPAVKWLSKVVADFNALRFEFSYSADYNLDHSSYSSGIIVCENGIHNRRQLLL
jgi:hypothetical protein